ncbi:MAG: efflux RND transporter permease subunit [Gammaproteobacteria bacterium]|nr:efflux RND transporter permease subunit [Gammaproteobacteria bacterium]
MSLPALSIKRHVLAYMLSAVLVLFGVISAERLGVDRIPRVEFPVLTVTTVLRGANPEIIDSSVTNVIESQINTVPGIDHIQSASSPGVSVVTVTFELEKDINVAFDETQTKVNQVLRQLPADVEPPIVSKVETNAQPILWLALQGDRTLQQLNQYARNVIKKRLETIDGVGEVRLGGRRDRNIRVNIRPDRMAALQVTVKDITEAFGKEHVQVPGGFLVGEKTENLIKLDVEFHSLNDLRNMIVAYHDTAPVRLDDVADIEDGMEDYRQLAHFKGDPSVGLGIVKIANTNSVEIISEVKKRLDEEIIPQLPAGMKITVSSDDSLFIMEMVKTLKEHLLLGTLLAAIIVWLFLKSVRSTLIIAVAIPVSLMGAVAAIYFSGFTFNSMTLLAMLLLVGVVVDDAIVVLENIFRHREEGNADAIAAAIEGSKQVQFAVLASSLTLVSIFAPVIFMQGIVGRFFESFATVVTIGVLVSLFVSLTLTPMLCSRYLRVSQQNGMVYRILENTFRALDRAYRRLLDVALAYRWSVVFLTLIIIASSSWFFAKVGKGFVPEEDEGRFMVFIKTPLGVSIDYTNDRLEKIEKVLGSHKEIITYFTAIGLGQAGQVNQGIAFVRLVPRGERTLKQSEVIDAVRKELMQIPGVRAFASGVPPIGGMRGEPLQFVVTGPNLAEVGRLTTAMQEKLGAMQELGRLDVDLQLDLPQIEMILDRTRAADLGISSRDVAQAVNVMAGGVDVARYNDVPGDGERYDIRLKAVESNFKQLADFSKIYLRSKDGKMVRLDTLAKFKQALGPAIISRYDMQYAANFAGSPSIPLGEAVNKVKQVADETLPAGYSIKFTGQAEQFGKTVNYMIFAFVLALGLVYMVLASQFNSFIQPMVIMLAQPLAIIGGVAGLWLLGHTLNIYSMIGLVLLIGLVAKNSILLVDLTNQMRSAGKDIDTALREACPIRMRPVLMTSATIILALLPAAIGIGAGSDTNGPLAVAVIGGMISSTLLTLVVVPAVYSLVEGGIVRWKGRR